MLVGLALAAWNLGSKALWYDETFEALLVMHAPLRFARWLATFETSGAFYHALLWGWKFLGTSELILRLPSVLFAVAAIPVAFAIARRLMPARWASVAVLLLATSGFWLHYAQEARPYALYLLLATLATLAMLRAVEQPQRGRWLAYAALGVLAVWTHLFMVFLLLGHLAALAAHPEFRSWRRPALAAVASGLLAGVPIAISVVLNLRRFGWMDGARPETIGRIAEEMAGDAGPLVLIAWLAAWLAGAAVAVGWWWRARSAAPPRSSERWPLLVIVLAALAPIALPWLISFARPMLVARYLMPALPFLFILAALALSAVRWRLPALAAAALLVAVNAAGVWYWYVTPDREDWRTATALVLEHGAPADGVVFFTRGTFDGGALYEYRYYLTQSPTADRPVALQLPAGPAPLADRVRAAIADRRVVIAVAYDWQSPETAHALAVIERDFELAADYPLERIGVRIYERAGTNP